jgi:hypothetical protein
MQWSLTESGQMIVQPLVTSDQMTPKPSEGFNWGKAKSKGV